MIPAWAARVAGERDYARVMAPGGPEYPGGGTGVLHARPMRLRGGTQPAATMLTTGHEGPRGHAIVARMYASGPDQPTSYLVAGRFHAKTAIDPTTIKTTVTIQTRRWKIRWRPLGPQARMIPQSSDALGGRAYGSKLKQRRIFL